MESRLFLVRHGEVEAPDSIRYSNGDRPLSDVGAEQISLLARELKKHGVKPAQILHSPLLRAVQTATIISDTVESHLHSWDLLADDISPARWGTELAPYFAEKSSPDTGGIMLVGHEPNLLGLIAAATAISPYAIDFSRGTLVELTISALSPSVRGRIKTVISSAWVDLTKLQQRVCN